MNNLLSDRGKNILLYLLTSRKLTTTKELANLFDISVRTVKYDLDNIREWLKERNIEICSKRGRGIWLDIKQEQKNSIKNDLLRLDKESRYYEQDKRLNRLMFEFLTYDGYLTSEGLSDKLFVTSNTVLHDIDRIEPKLNHKGLFLIRKNGKGFNIKGDELNKRLLLEEMIQNELSEYDIYSIMTRLVTKKDDKDSPINIGFSERFQQTYEQVLYSVSDLVKTLKLDKLNYSDILSITIRLSISIYRLFSSKPLDDYLPPSIKLNIKKEDETPFLMVKAVFNQFELPILESEFNYIYSDYSSNTEIEDVKYITEHIVEIVEKQLEIPFLKDRVLITNLFAHLSIRLLKDRVYVNEYNPFVVDIKAKYQTLFEAIYEASKECVKRRGFLINDSFVSYIALHFIVSMEKFKTKEVIRVMYVCSTGIGVTSLLQQTIEEALNDVFIVSFASILNIQDELKKKEPDLIISVFPIEDSDIPWIKVNPIPSEMDMRAVQDVVDELLQRRRVEEEPNNQFLKKRMRTLNDNEAISLEMIVTGYTIYERLKEELSGYIIEKYLDSFLLHILLMVHRLYFDKQYQSERSEEMGLGKSVVSLMEVIERVFEEQELKVNRSELIAVLNYMKGEEEKHADV